MTRSILAIIIGYLVFAVFSIATHLFWSSPDQLSVFASCAAVVGMVGGGYVAALISRRAPLTHSFGVVILSFVVTIVMSHLNGQQHTIRQLTLGMLDSTLHFTWGGLIRVWKIRYWQVGKSSPNTALEPTPTAP